MAAFRSLGATAAAQLTCSRVGSALLLFALLAFPLGLTACAPTPRPLLLAKVAEVRTSPAAQEAETWAPQAHAHALELEQSSERAATAGDTAAAEILAEHALAAHEHAWVLTRLARAERRRLSAEAELSEQQRALGELLAQDQQLSADAAALELRARVVRSALPLAAHDAATPERLEARRRAAAALSTQGRLLCVAASMLGEANAVKAPLGRLDELDRELDAGKAQKALEVATELRGECLRVISNARRQHSAVSAPAPVAAATKPSAAATSSAPSAAIPADLLLSELSTAGQLPSRDERGVSVVLRGVFAADGKLNDSGRGQLARLVEVAKAHPDFPVLLVGHTAVPDARAAMDRQLGALESELQTLGVERVASHDAGARQPLLPAQLPRARERNQRIELVFVAPGS
jgi:outer membrane protein OmpA-like peptidoglycan-associated protein